MPRFIVKLSHEKQDYYLEWSTIVDAPVTYGMSLEEFREYYRDEYGHHGFHDLAQRIARVEEKGTSSQIHASVDDLICANRAGDGESCLSKQDIIRKYCLERPAPEVENIQVASEIGDS